VTEGGGGVVVSLAMRPASPVRVAGFGRSDLGDDRLWSLLGQDASVQASTGSAVGQGVLSGVRVGAGNPEAVGMVAVAALLGDQLGEAPVMVGRAGGVLVHGAVLDGGDVLQAVVSDHPDAGGLLQQEGRVAKDQVGQPSRAVRGG
jgi:hypothetical protein